MTGWFGEEDKQKSQEDALVLDQGVVCQYWSSPPGTAAGGGGGGWACCHGYRPRWGVTTDVVGLYIP